MDRLACIDLPAFPLQILLKRHPGWSALPAAVVDKDRPQGILLWVNERAREQRILPGTRYAAGLSLSRELRAGVVEPAEISSAIQGLAQRLRFASPDVEPSEAEPGLFWIGGSGLSLVFPSLERWVKLLSDELVRAGFQSEIVVGFSRFGTYAAAKCGRRGLGLLQDGQTKTMPRVRSPRKTQEDAAGNPAPAMLDPASTPAILGSAAPGIIFSTPEEESRVVRGIPIDRLAFDPAARDALAKLGIRTLGAFLDLPGESIQKRFPRDVHHLHQLGRGELWDPVQPRDPAPRFLERRVLEDPEPDRERLLLHLDAMLESVLEQLAAEGQAAAGIVLRMVLEHDGTGGRTEEGEKKALPRHEERLQPAAPTLDRRPLHELIQLRLEALVLPAGVIELELEATAVPFSTEQLQLLVKRPRRDIAAVERAFARLRAEFGNEVVARARLRDGHLPEARYAWEPLTSLPAARARRVALRPLVRRIFERPLLLPPRPRNEPDGWLIAGLEGGAVEEILGPFIVSGGWWRKPIHREYHYARTDRGRWLWVYYDRDRRRWFCQGEVE